MKMKATIGVVFCLFAGTALAAITPPKQHKNADLGTKGLLDGNTTTECYYEACPPGWSKQSYSKCFKMRPNPATHALASADCRALGSTLAVIRSDAERNFLNQFAIRERPLNTGLWLGAQRLGDYWFTSDLSSFTYNAWVPGHPDFSEGVCASLLSDASQLESSYWGRLAMGRCDKPLNYACQMIQYDYDKIICKPRDPANPAKNFN